MDHRDHVRLIENGVRGAGPIWADLGSGGGAFTLALADLLGEAGIIHSVDRDAQALGAQARAVVERFPAATLRQYQADFSRPLQLPTLDGVVMANALHFVRHKAAVLTLVQGYLRPGGHFVLVEYDADAGNPWVPYPISMRSWFDLAGEVGFRGTHEIARVPSRFLGSIYAAVSWA
jgi:ubiquinone/menaquinone biosynthesis C-methylase UbiE